MIYLKFVICDLELIFQNQNCCCKILFDTYLKNDIHILMSFKLILTMPNPLWGGDGKPRVSYWRQPGCLNRILLFLPASFVFFCCFIRRSSLMTWKLNTESCKQEMSLLSSNLALCVIELNTQSTRQTLNYLKLFPKNEDIVFSDK